MALKTQSGGSNQRSFQAMSFALPQYALWRPCRIRVLVGQCVDELLNFDGCLQRPQRSHVVGDKPKAARPSRVPFFDNPQPFADKAASVPGSCGDYTEISSYADWTLSSSWTARLDFEIACQNFADS